MSRWACPKCEYKTEQPDFVNYVSHPCKQVGRRVALKVEAMRGAH